MSVHIEINSTYAIRSDAHQWILAKSAESAEGVVWNGTSGRWSLLGECNEP